MNTKINKLAPILLFTYNRLDHTQKTISYLSKNILAKDSNLIIYSDAPKDNSSREQIESVNNVRKYLQGIKDKQYFKSVEIIQRERNLGLANSIIDGVTNVVEKEGKVIVLEDDLITSPYFLSFMNEALNIYENNQKVGCISGFIFPLDNYKDLPNTFFLKGADCWGWATWARAWKIFNPNGRELLKQLNQTGIIKDFDASYYDSRGIRGFINMLEDQINGKNSSWAIRWVASCFLNDKYCLYPRLSLIQNIGFDVGTHCNGGKEDDPYFGILTNEEIKIDTTQEVLENKEARIASDKYYNKKRPILLKRLCKKLKDTIAQITGGGGKA